MGSCARRSGTARHAAAAVRASGALEVSVIGLLFGLGPACLAGSARRRLLRRVPEKGAHQRRGAPIPRRASRALARPSAARSATTECTRRCAPRRTMVAVAALDGVAITSRRCARGGQSSRRCGRPAPRRLRESTRPGTTDDGAPDPRGGVGAPAGADFASPEPRVLREETAVEDFSRPPPRPRAASTAGRDAMRALLGLRGVDVGALARGR